MSFDFGKIVSYQTKVHYASPKELKYSSDPGFLLSPYDYESYLSMVEGSLSQGIPWVSFPLKSFNSPSIYYCHCSEITNAIDDLTSMFQADLLFSGSLLSDRDPFDFDRSRIYSEIEGSVNVEEVPTTRRRLKELLEEGAPAKERNDVIIKNMAEAIRFVHRKPAFNKDNLLYLYHLLSEGCLDEEDRLPKALITETMAWRWMGFWAALRRRSKNAWIPSSLSLSLLCMARIPFSVSSCPISAIITSSTSIRISITTVGRPGWCPIGSTCFRAIAFCPFGLRGHQPDQKRLLPSHPR